MLKMGVGGATGGLNASFSSGPRTYDSIIHPSRNDGRIRDYAEPDARAKDPNAESVRTMGR